MKKQNLKSLTLKKNTVSNFEIVKVNGGISGNHPICNPSHADSRCCPHSVVHTCNYSDQRTCTLDTF